MDGQGVRGWPGHSGGGHGGMAHPLTLLPRPPCVGSPRVEIRQLTTSDDLRQKLEDAFMPLVNMFLGAAKVGRLTPFPPANGTAMSA
jgi:hypothetical protein